jgi:subtilisin family serine protease
VKASFLAGLVVVVFLGMVPGGNDSSWAETCPRPPNYNHEITVTEQWQVTEQVKLGQFECRSYRMYLYPNRSYDFSLCSGDGYGGSAHPGKGYMVMSDWWGLEQWSLGGGQSCQGDATTLGTAYEQWVPPKEGYYYLGVREINNRKVTYSLAYRCSGEAFGRIRIEPNSLEHDCVGILGSVAAESCDTEHTPGQRELNDPNDKLIDAERVLSGFAEGKKRVRVIVNLAEPAQTPAQVNWKSHQWRAQRRQKISQQQAAVLAVLGDSEFRLRNRFENQACFSGQVTAHGLEKLKKHPKVVAIEPVVILEAHLRQGIDLINAASHRTAYNGEGMAIAICDTGIDYNHPRLGGGGFPNSKVLGGYDFGDRDSDPGPSGHAHGTSCAGIAAGDLGSTGDYIGGVAYNAKLYSLKISFGDTGSAYSDDMAAAWDWCVTHQNDDPNHPIMAISTSFGGGFWRGYCDGDNSAMTNAANNATAAGMSVLASAANDGWCNALAWPACIKSVISVGAVYDAAFGLYYPCVDNYSCVEKHISFNCPTLYHAIDDTQADLVTSYSNTSILLDVLAPSNRAYTLDIAGSAGYSGGDYYGAFGGTSAACPYAAGAVACLQSAAKAINGEFLSAKEVRKRLIASGDTITDPKSGMAKPRVNLGRTIDRLAQMASGAAFAIHNDGRGLLDVNSITAPTWVTLEPLPPYKILPGDWQEVYVDVDCAHCNKWQMSGHLSAYSNDPNESVYSKGVYVSARCCDRPGSLDEDCDADWMDFALFALHWLDRDCGPANGYCDGADFDNLGAVNARDLSIFTEIWLAE